MTLFSRSVVNFYHPRLSGIILAYYCFISSFCSGRMLMPCINPNNHEMLKMEAERFLYCDFTSLNHSCLWKNAILSLPGRAR